MSKINNIISNLNIDYLGKVKYTAVFSAFLIIASIFLLSTKGLNFGLDFTGGSTMELKSKEKINTDEIRDLLKVSFPKIQVQKYGTDYDVQVRVPSKSGETDAPLKNVQKILKTTKYNFTVEGQSNVGAQYGDELVNRGVLALILALAGIMIYISTRFQYKLSLGAVAALAHDIIITLGFFALSQIEFNLTVLAALLAVLGYSVNDTVVVFDRIRENFRLMHSFSEKDITNKSINQTMGRTIITSLTTLLSVVAIALLGGNLLFGFATALIVGILVGTYSSIFIASALALKLKLSKDDLTPKTIAEIDDMP